MPDWVMHDEIWKRAKHEVRQEYPDIDEDSDRFYKLVTEVYKRMGGKIKGQE